MKMLVAAVMVMLSLPVVVAFAPVVDNSPMLLGFAVITVFIGSWRSSTTRARRSA